MKTTWPRVDKVPKINHDDQELTYAWVRMLESSAGCCTMFLFAVSCKIGALERNAY